MFDSGYELTDLEIDELFLEATKPYDYFELIRRAKDKGLDKKVNAHVIAAKITQRLHDENLQKAKQQNGV